MVTWWALDLTEDSWGWLQFSLPAAELGTGGLLRALPSGGTPLESTTGDQFKVVPLSEFNSYPNLVSTAGRELYPTAGCFANVESANRGSRDLGGHPRRPHGYAEDFAAERVWGYYTVPTEPAWVCYRRPGDDWRVLETMLFPQPTAANVTYWLNDTRAGTWGRMELDDPTGAHPMRPAPNTWYSSDSDDVSDVDPLSAAVRLVRAGGNCMNGTAPRGTEIWDLGPHNPSADPAQSYGTLTAWVMLPHYDSYTSPAAQAGWYVCLKIGWGNWQKLSNPRYSSNVYATAGGVDYSQDYADRLRTSRGPEVFAIMNDRRGGTLANLTLSAFAFGFAHSYYIFETSDRHYIAANSTPCWAALPAAEPHYVIAPQREKGATVRFMVPDPDPLASYRLCYLPGLTPNAFEVVLKYGAAASTGTPELEPLAVPPMYCTVWPPLAGAVANITFESPGAAELDTDPAKDQMKIVRGSDGLACADPAQQEAYATDLTDIGAGGPAQTDAARATVELPTFSGAATAAFVVCYKYFAHDNWLPVPQRPPPDPRQTVTASAALAVPLASGGLAYSTSEGAGAPGIAAGAVTITFRRTCCWHHVVLDSRPAADGGDEAAIVPQGQLCGVGPAAVSTRDLGPGDFGRLPSTEWRLELPAAPGSYRVCYRRAGAPWTAVKEEGADAGYLTVVAPEWVSVSIDPGEAIALDRPGWVVGGAYLKDAVTVAGVGLSTAEADFKIPPAGENCHARSVPGTEVRAISGDSGVLLGSLAIPVWGGNYSLCFRNTGIWARVGSVAVVPSLLHFLWSSVTRRITVVDRWTTGEATAPVDRPGISAAEETVADEATITGTDRLRLADAAAPAGCGVPTTLGAVVSDPWLPVFRNPAGLDAAGALYLRSARTTLLDATTWPPSGGGFHVVCYYRFVARTGARVAAGFWVQLPKYDSHGAGFTLVPGLQVQQPAAAAIVGPDWGLINETEPLQAGEVFEAEFELRAAGGALTADHEALYVSAGLSGAYAASAASCPPWRAGAYGWPADGGTEHLQWGRASLWLRALSACGGSCDLFLSVHRAEEQTAASLDWSAVRTQRGIPIDPQPIAALLTDPPVSTVSSWWAAAWDGEWVRVRGYAAALNGHPYTAELAAGRTVNVTLAGSDTPGAADKVFRILCRPAAACSGEYRRLARRPPFRVTLDAEGEMNAEFAFTFLEEFDALHPNGAVFRLLFAPSWAPVTGAVSVPILVRPILPQRLVLLDLAPDDPEHQLGWAPEGGAYGSAVRAAPGYTLRHGIPYTATIEPQNAEGMAVLQHTAERLGYRPGWDLRADTPELGLRFQRYAAVRHELGCCVGERSRLRLTFRATGRCTEAAPCTIHLGMRGRPELSVTITTPVRRLATALAALEAPPAPLLGTPGRSLGRWVIRAVDDDGRVDSFNYGSVQPLLLTSGAGVRARLVSTLPPKQPPPGGWLPWEHLALGLVAGVAVVEGLAIDRPCPEGDCALTFHNTWGGRLLSTGPVTVLSDAERLQCSVVPHPGVVAISVGAVFAVEVWVSSTKGGRSGFPDDWVYISGSGTGPLILTDGPRQRRLHQGAARFAGRFDKPCGSGGCSITVTARAGAPGSWSADAARGQCSRSFALSARPAAEGFAVRSVIGADGRGVDTVSDPQGGLRWIALATGRQIEVRVDAVGYGNLTATSFSGSSSRGFVRLAAAPEVGDPVLEGSGGAIRTFPAAAARKGVAFVNGSALFTIRLTGACLKCRVLFEDLSGSVGSAAIFVTSLPSATRLALTAGAVPMNDTDATRQVAYGGPGSPWLPELTVHGVDAGGAIDYITDYSVAVRKQGGVGLQRWVCHQDAPCLNDRTEEVVVWTGRSAGVLERIAAVQASRRGGARFRLAGLHAATLEDAPGARDMWGRLKFTTDTASANNTAVASYTAPFPTYWAPPGSIRRLAVRDRRMDIDPRPVYEVADGPGYMRQNGTPPDWFYAERDAVAVAVPFPVTVQVEDAGGSPVLGVDATVLARLMPAARPPSPVTASCGTGVRLGGTRTVSMVNGNATLWLRVEAPCESCVLRFELTTPVLPEGCTEGTASVLCPHVPVRHRVAYSRPLTLRRRPADAVIVATPPAEVPSEVRAGEPVRVELHTVYFLAGGRVAIRQSPDPGVRFSVAAVAAPAAPDSARQGFCGGALRGANGSAEARASIGADGVAVLELRFPRACLGCAVEIRPQHPLTTPPFLLRNQGGTAFTVRNSATRIEGWPAPDPVLASSSAVPAAVGRGEPFALAVAAVDDHGDRAASVDAGYGGELPEVLIGRPRTAGGIASGGVLRHLGGGQAATDRGWRKGTFAARLAFTHPCQWCAVTLSAGPALEGSAEAALAVHAAASRLLVSASPRRVRVGEPMWVSLTAVDSAGWLARGAGGDTALDRWAPPAAVTLRLADNVPGLPSMPPGPRGTGGLISSAAGPLQLVDGRGALAVRFSAPAAGSLLEAAAALPAGTVRGATEQTAEVLPDAGMLLALHGAGGAARSVLLGNPFAVAAQALTPDGFRHGDTLERGVRLRWGLNCTAAELAEAPPAAGALLIGGALRLRLTLRAAPGFEAAEFAVNPEECTLNASLVVPDAGPSPPWAVVAVPEMQLRLLISAAPPTQLWVGAPLTSAVAEVPVRVPLRATDSLGNTAAGAEGVRVTLSRLGGTGCGDPQGRAAAVLAHGEGAWEVHFLHAGVCTLRAAAAGLLVPTETWELRVQRRWGLAVLRNLTADAAGAVAAGAQAELRVAVVDSDGEVVEGDNQTELAVSVHDCGPAQRVRVLGGARAVAGVAALQLALALATPPSRPCMLRVSATGLTGEAAAAETWAGPVWVTARASRLRFLRPEAGPDGAMLAVTGAPFEATVAAVDDTAALFGDLAGLPNPQLNYTGVAVADLTAAPGWDAGAGGCPLCGSAAELRGGVGTLYLQWAPGSGALPDVDADLPPDDETPQRPQSDPVPRLDAAGGAPLVVRADGLGPARASVRFVGVAALRYAGGSAAVVLPVAAGQGAAAALPLETLTPGGSRHPGDFSTKISATLVVDESAGLRLAGPAEATAQGGAAVLRIAAALRNASRPLAEDAPATLVVGAVTGAGVHLPQLRIAAVVAALPGGGALAPAFASDAEFGVYLWLSGGHLGLDTARFARAVAESSGVAPSDVELVRACTVEGPPGDPAGLADCSDLASAVAGMRGAHPAGLPLVSVRFGFRLRPSADSDEPGLTLSELEAAVATLDSALRSGASPLAAAFSVAVAALERVVLTPVPAPPTPLPTPAPSPAPTPAPPPPERETGGTLHNASGAPVGMDLVSAAPPVAGGAALAAAAATVLGICGCS
eukprot:TRINITY_DN27408_c0_g1_i2.p1 TRINITY_DN27408_c0_g1~~TRINITY_DN27408_c0_g1_i2.p1  ORF type:complete len:3854 (+),score=1045.50 TRINITY_DN27408_c0_g1_i2:1585-11562(+)